MLDFCSQPDPCVRCVGRKAIDIHFAAKIALIRNSLPAFQGLRAGIVSTGSYLEKKKELMYFSSGTSIVKRKYHRNWFQNILFQSNHSGRNQKDWNRERHCGMDLKSID